MDYGLNTRGGCVMNKGKFARVQERVGKIRGSVGKKVIGAYVIAVVLLLWVAWATLNYHKTEIERRQKAFEVHQGFEVLVNELEGKLSKVLSSREGFFLTGEERYLESYQGAVLNFKECLGETKDLVSSPQREFEPLDWFTRLQHPRVIRGWRPLKAEDNITLIEEISTRSNYLLTLAEQEVRLKKRMDSLEGLDKGRLKGEIVVTLNKMAQTQKEIAAVFQEVRKKEREIMSRESMVANWYGMWVNLNQYFLMFGAILLVLIGWLFTKVIFVTPLVTMTEVASKITEGDLEQEVKITSKDELGILAQSFNQMTQRLKEIINYQRTQINKILGVVAAVSQG
ncbi:MAG: hypothetical protein COS84_11635, partial [Armatimonadetes bacterium CG07_land_8_20_14_0_80_40_9]